MTDNTPWQPPSDAPKPPPAFPAAEPFTPPGGAPPPPPPVGPSSGQPQYGPPQPGQYGPPQPGYGAGGWTPPPKPGLIPLRPLAFGTLLGATFQVLRRNPKPTFGFALIITSIVMVLTIVLVGTVTFLTFSRAEFASADDRAAIEAGSTAMILISALIPAALSIVLAAIVQGVVALEVARGTLGEKNTLRGLWRGAKGRIGALVGWTLLITLAVFVAIVIVALIIGALAAFAGDAGIAGAIIVGILAVFGGLVASLWLSTRLCLVPSVLMLERLTLREAIARSWTLTGGYFWKTLGIVVLVAVIVQTVSSIITVPLNLVMTFSTTLLNPNQVESGAIIAVVVVAILTIVVTLVFSAIAMVIQSATPALIYIDLRMRKEGLDLELVRFVEARQTGDDSVADPYRQRAAGLTPPPPAMDSPWS